MKPAGALHNANPQAAPPARCRSCQQAIVWAVTVYGRNMPFDAEPSDEGTFILRRDEPGAPLAVHHSKVLPSEQFAPRYRSHFATCPNAAEHRRAR